MYNILLLTNRDSDNVGDQTIEACDIALIKTVMKNLGVHRKDYKISSRAAAIVPKEYVKSLDAALLESGEKSIAEADLVVFGGAPLFNYLYQIFYERTAVTLELCEKHGTPVIFSAIGVESYDEDNEKCQRLKGALNLSCVKQITTRDNLEYLQNYRVREDIVIDKVADPAVFAAEVMRNFASHPAPRAKKKIGVFVIRANAFKDNKINFSPQEAAALWCGVVDELKARGYDYELLTSGHFGDEAYLDRLIRTYHFDASKCCFGMNYPELLAEKISSYDGVISCRLHPSIISYSFSVPAVSLVWNPKIPGFYNSAGYPERAVFTEGITAAGLVDQLEDAMAAGVQRDEAYLMSIYRSLFWGIARGLGIDVSEVAPYGYDKLVGAGGGIAAFGGTSETEKSLKQVRKFRRTYEKYNVTFDKLASARKKNKQLTSELQQARANAKPMSLARRALRKIKRMLKRVLGR